VILDLIHLEQRAYRFINYLNNHNELLTKSLIDSMNNDPIS
jgi:hypothetical protein